MKIGVWVLKETVFPLILIVCLPLLVEAQATPDIDAKMVATKIQERFEACPRREVVGSFERKHHKIVWEKQAWGPPSEVFVDVKPNDSVLYPYILTVEFSLVQTFGPERDNKADAEKDSDLVPLTALLTGRYRYTYLVSKDSVRLKIREVRDQKLDGSDPTWKEKPLWAGACWDQIGVK
jgi:hypothetical protein